MNRSALIALALCILAMLIGGAGLWRSATIVADTTPPEIRQTRPSDGESFVVTGQLSVKCWVYENMELDSVKCTIYEKTLFGWNRLETITLSLEEELKNDVYLYIGAFTGSVSSGSGSSTSGGTATGGEGPFMSWTLQVGRQYKLKFEAVDKAGNTDSYTLTFTPVEASPIDGYVTVNGKRVSGPDDTVYVNSLSLVIKVYITSGEEQLDRLVLMLNGEFLSNFTKRSGYYETTYRLPREGRYSFQVYAYDKLAQSYEFASFTIVLENRMKWLTLLGAAAVLGLVAVYGYAKRGGRSGR